MVLPGTRGCRPAGSAWVACCLRQSDIYQLVEEFGIPPEFVVSVPLPDSHRSSPPLGDEHRAATTPLATRSSRGTPSSSNQWWKRTTAALPGSSSKKPRPSSFALPPSSSARLASTPPPPPPRDLGVGSWKSPSSPVGGCIII
ncbi:UNVERIFIED_CONTAM: hypothetical protein Slati_3723600 [Sesamum latifolium]|uniref:Uncharacterized protein n=1 Tax=Sesamum latifolium TaxID=2727402 RepID=A0AAW2U2I2_9LAMI